jgi:hypothetical protein
MTPARLSDSPDAKWRLLELVLQAEGSASRPRRDWPEILLCGDAFSAATLAAARALAGAYEVRIRFAAFHDAPDPGLLGHLFARGGDPLRRVFYLHGQPRFSARSRRGFASIRQFGRFPGDEDLWRRILSRPDTLRLHCQQRGLRFHLITQDDLDRFESAIAGLGGVEWTLSNPTASEDTDE